MEKSQLIAKFKIEKRKIAGRYVCVTQDEYKERDMVILKFATDYLSLHSELTTVDSMGSPARVIRNLKRLYNVS